MLTFHRPHPVRVAARGLSQNHNFVGGERPVHMTLRAAWVRWLLVVFAIGCFVVGLLPRSNEWVDPVTGDKVSERRVGVWFSPLYHRVDREFVQGGVRSGEIGINWLCLSSLVSFIGVVSVAIGLTGRYPGQPRLPAPDTDQQKS
jgi:hypothetical protein